MANGQKDNDGYTIVVGKKKNFKKKKKPYFPPRPQPPPLPSLDARPPIDTTPRTRSPPPRRDMLARLPPELRVEIFSLVLPFRPSSRFARPLHHRLGLLPFLFTSETGNKRTKLAEEIYNLLPNAKQPSYYTSVWARSARDNRIGILVLNRTCFAEAIDVFYQINKIVVPSELVCIKRLRKLVPSDSDLTLVRMLKVSPSSSVWVDPQTAVRTTLEAVHLRFSRLKTLNLDAKDLTMRPNLTDI